MTSFYGEYREKNIINDEEENRISRANVDKWIFRLLLILIGFMPLIVLGYVGTVVSPLVSENIMLSSGNKGNLFTHYKSLIVLMITVLAGLLLLSKIFFMNGSFRKTKFNYILGAFASLIVISTILSPNIEIALNGHYDRSEGAIMWLCYIALIFIAMNINLPKKVVSYVMYVLVPFVIINFCIITMNFTGNDLLQNELVQNIISVFLPEGTTIAEGSSLVGTLNHGNYMSGMFAILTMMYLTGIIIEKNTYLKILNLLLSMVSIIVIFMSLSTSGFLTILFISPFILWILIKSDKKIISIALLAVFIILSGLSLHILAQKNSKVWDESFGFFTSSNPYEEETKTSFTKRSYDFGQFILGDKVSAADNTFELPILPETGVGAGSGRIYIWEKTLNLLMERPLVGYGLDTLMYNFPHYNIDARANLETETVIVDKPHNMYIGVLYGTGILGFIAFMGIVILTALLSFRRIVFYKQHVIGNDVVLAVAYLAFLFQAIFNDTLVGVATPFWIMIGILVMKSPIKVKTN